MNEESIKNLKEYNDLVKEGIFLARELKDSKAETAIIDLESKKNYEAIKRITSDLRDEYKGISSDSMYIAQAYKRLVQDIGKGNVGLSTAKSALSKLSDIARDITINQKDINSLSKKQIDTYKTQLATQKKNLEISYGLVSNAKGQEELAGIIKGEIGEQTILYNDLLKSIEKQEERLKDVNSILGLAGNTVTFIKEGMGKVGLGGLASMLKFDDVLEKSKEKADKLSNVNLNLQLIDLKSQKEELDKTIKQYSDESFQNKLIKNEKGKLYKLKNELEKEIKVLSKEKVFSPMGSDERSKIESELNSKKEEILKLKDNIKSIEKRVNDEIDENIDDITNSQKILNEEILKTEKNLSKGMFSKRWEVLKTTVKELGKGFKELLTDPMALWGVIIVGVLKSFAELNKTSVEFQRLTGTTANLWESNIHPSIISSTDYIKELSNLTKQFGVNAQFAFDSFNVVEMSEMTQLMGMSADQAGNLARMAQTSNQSLANMNESMVKAVNNFNKTNNIGINHRQVIEDIAKSSSALQISMGKNPTHLARAAAEARKLGLELSALENIASSLLDFESSISAQLEAELLTGKQINLEKARSYALMNDMEGMARELNTIQQLFNSYVNGNRIQQESIAKSMGMNREQMGEMIMQSKLYGDLTEKQRAQAMGMTIEDMKRLEIQQSLNKSIEKMAEALAVPLEFLASMLDHTWILYGVMGLMATIIGGKLLSSLKASLLMFKGLALAAKKTAIMQAWTAAMSGPKSILTGGLVGMAIGGLITAAIMGAFNKKDDMISPGYGKRILSAPEGTYALNDKDSIIAGTNLFDNKTENTNISSSSIDISPLVQAIHSLKQENIEMKEILNKILHKDSNVYMDGNKVGIALTTGTANYSLQ